MSPGCAAALRSPYSWRAPGLEHQRAREPPPVQRPDRPLFAARDV